MADVYTVTFSIIGILISLPALLAALTLLLPQLTQQIETRLREHPKRSFVLGVPVTAVFALWIAITANAGSGVVRATAFIAAFAGMGLGTLGAAGLARLLGARLAPLSGPKSEITHLLRGAVVYELACLFPIVGWFLFAPLAGITLLGAATSALLRALVRKPTTVVSGERLSVSSER